MDFLYPWYENSFMMNWGYKNFTPGPTGSLLGYGQVAGLYRPRANTAQNVMSKFTSDPAVRHNSIIIIISHIQLWYYPKREDMQISFWCSSPELCPSWRKWAKVNVNFLLNPCNADLWFPLTPHRWLASIWSLSDSVPMYQSHGYRLVP